MAEHDLALMAHLMRRAGFGAPYEELEARAATGYEATVEELLHPESQPDGIEMDILERYVFEWREMLAGGPASAGRENRLVLAWYFMYRLV